MLVIIKPVEGTNQDLQINQTIFFRPTPIKVVLGLAKAFFTRSKAYQFARIPDQHLSLDIDYMLHDGDVSGERDGKKVFMVPVEPLSLRNAVQYNIESYTYGFDLAFWNWRWSAGTMTQKEMQAKMEQFEEQLKALQRRKSRRIEEDDDE